MVLEEPAAVVVEEVAQRPSRNPRGVGGQEVTLWCLRQPPLWWLRRSRSDRLETTRYPTAAIRTTTRTFRHRAARSRSARFSRRSTVSDHRVFTAAHSRM